jgi:hypothetical protein
MNGKTETHNKNTTMKIKLTLTEEMLGTKASNPDVFADFIASKHPSGTPQRDELDNAEHREEAGTTVFHRENGQVGIYDYQIKGFFKDACGAMNRFDKEARGGLEKLAAYKSKIDGCIFVSPRFIPITIVEGGKVGVCERPLRADTAQGPRVSLCRSETIPPGSTIEFEVQVLSKDLLAYVQAWFGYGKLRGLGQWRNSGKGRFNWAEQNS